ncbi:LOW QUALITY PROTEIN: pumilio homolog 4-like [Carica papaya]|uniref:LOW QUALITY PROTEIN: pumilio homolog 4-like n=1 Tax=Carica papaya TaxID=3649 RepID=UPI000B8CAB3E|nr:LOW QUALITY PROTEIN: pumilio homolog 4-like [Carica papaya]
MVNGSNMDMLPTTGSGLQSSHGDLQESLQRELELILQEQRNQQINQQILGRERDLSMYRSGSAPPTVEGSLSAVGSLFMNSDFNDLNSLSNSDNNQFLSEDEIRSHPAYLSYYYSHEHVNPRLPPPLLSKEDWRVAQRFQAGGSSFSSLEDWRKKKVDGADSSSLFVMQPGLSVQQAENDLMEMRNASTNNLSRNMSIEWLGRGSDDSVGLSGTGLGPRRKSFADIVQGGVDRNASLPGHPSRPSSCNSFRDMVDTTVVSDFHSAGLCNGLQAVETLHFGAAPPAWMGVQGHAPTDSHSLASAVGSSLSRSTTPEPQLVGRSLGPGLPPVGSRVVATEKKNAIGSSVQNGQSAGATELAEIAASLSGLALSKTRQVNENCLVQSKLQMNLDSQCDLISSMPNDKKCSLQQIIENSCSENLPYSTKYGGLLRKNGMVANLSASVMGSNGQINIPKRTSSFANLYSRTNSSGLGSFEGSSVHNQNANFASMDFTEHVPGTTSTVSGDGQSLNRLVNQLGSDVHSPVTDPRYIQHLQRTSNYATRGPSDPSFIRNHVGSSHGDLDGLQKMYLEALLAQHNQQYDLPRLGKSGGLNHAYYGNPSYGLGMPFPGNPMANSVLPSLGSGRFKNDRVPRFPSMMRSQMGGSPGPWQSEVGNAVDGRYMSSLLDEFKNNKARSFELSDIADHVVEFSTDQYGSRFIQQKLETATVEEKNLIFPEIIPHARTLMTDVFGNYVIQKFFEYGMENQRRELASQLIGHVLPLSLQMYGCRVIQKALEVVDVNQQTQMVAELDGAVMKCVRDQNGNHVIQKCIECVPQDRIQFIISAFYGQVVSLSTHPYGCRVIQRVLEHCHDISTQQIIMDEIMQSVCTLAQDQYGNYVIQHVLEHGKPHERSAIICKLAGQIVKMSQQKFASNVVEKCLTFGGPEERQLLVKEMLGSTDENEPLQAMMKDAFGNYVVQKVLETCDDQKLELILSRIKVHLTALKRYTYGKHIVSRVEKLITTGERRIGLSSSSQSA